MVVVVGGDAAGDAGCGSRDAAPRRLPGRGRTAAPAARAAALSDAGVYPSADSGVTYPTEPPD